MRRVFPAGGRPRPLRRTRTHPQRSWRLNSRPALCWTHGGTIRACACQGPPPTPLGGSLQNPREPNLRQHRAPPARPQPKTETLSWQAPPWESHGYFTSASRARVEAREFHVRVRAPCFWKSPYGGRPAAPRRGPRPCRRGPPRTGNSECAPQEDPLPGRVVWDLPRRHGHGSLWGAAGRPHMATSKNRVHQTWGRRT